MGGYSNSSASGDRTGNFLGVTDYWLVKMSANGTKELDRRMGGDSGDYLMSVQQTKDKGFILGGYSNSHIGYTKSEDTRGGNDYWIVKTDSLGDVQWEKTLGGSGDDKLSGIYEIASGQYIVAGTSLSPKSGDKSGKPVGSAGAADYWIMRLSDLSAAKVGGASHIVSDIFSKKRTNFELVQNPVSNTLTVKYSVSASNKASFAIYSAEGKVLQRADLTASQGTITHSFKVGNLPGGVYYITMYTGNGGEKITRSFVKE